MTHLTRFTKSEELIGLQFEGTPESAKEIVEWIKSVIGDQYQRGTMQRGKTQYMLGYDVGRLIPEAVLVLTLNHLPETYTFSAPAGAYIVYDPTELEVRFRVTSPQGLSHWTKVVMHGNVSED